MAVVRSAADDDWLLSGLCALPALCRSLRLIPNAPMQIALNGLYVFKEMCEKKPAYVLAGSKTKYYIYWAPQYKRWYVGPTMGSGNILCYKDSTKSKLEPTFPFDDPYGAMSFWNGDKWATDDASVKFVALESMWRDDPV